MKRIRAALAVVALLGIAAARSSAQDALVADREWNQERANAQRTGNVDVEPLRLAPGDAWRHPLDGELAAGPVTWGGTVYVAVQRSGGLWLESRRIADGSECGKFRVVASTGAGLAAYGGTVVLSIGKSIRGYRHVGILMSTLWNIRHKGDACAPMIWDGKVLWFDGARMRLVDAITGRESDVRVDVRPPVTVQDGPGTPRLVVLDAFDDAALMGIQAALYSYSLETGELVGRDRVATFVKKDGAGPVAPIHLRDAFEGTGAWVVVSPAPFKAEVGSSFGLVFPASRDRYRGSSLIDIRSEPVVVGGSVLGFSDRGALLTVDENGRFVELIAPRRLPAGAKPGPGTAAREVAYLGNWALDTVTRKILWVRPDLDLVGPMIPAGDGRILAVTSGGDLVCLEGAPAAGSSTGAEPGPSSATAIDGSSPFAPLPSPLETPGVLTRDGEFRSGVPAAGAGGHWTVSTEEGAAPAGVAATFPVDELSLVVHPGGRAQRTGPEMAVFNALRNAALSRRAAALDGIFREAVDLALVAKAKEILEEARRLGLPPARAEYLLRSLAGRREAARPGSGPGILDGKRNAAAEECTGLLRRSAAWCADQHLAGAATLLHLEAAGPAWLDPGVDVEAKRTLIGPLVPAGFPWRDASDGIEKWLRWAPHVVATEAEFVPAAAPNLVGSRPPPWDRDTVILRTPELLFLSRCMDPAVVGTCIDAGDRAVAMLKRILPAGSVKEVRDKGDLLHVRLHANERDYRSEKSATGSYPVSWTVGYYSGAERVSRFFVPEDGGDSPLGRGLRDTMAHEVTHHFLDMRWIRDGKPGHDRPGDPGYWCIEGMARHVEDQVCSPTAGAHRDDDPTVRSVDIMSQAFALGVQFKPSEFLEMTRDAFHRLDTAPKHRIRMLRTLQTRILSDLDLFYEQAGTTTFYLLHRAGPERRAAFLRYLAGHYDGRTPTPAWRALGWSSAEEFDGDFNTFLKGLAR